jgi:Holliday junction resolvasome RuvABC endonuclease subunit
VPWGDAQLTKFKQLKSSFLLRPFQHQDVSHSRTGRGDAARNQIMHRVKLLVGHLDQAIATHTAFTSKVFCLFLSTRPTG